MSHVDNKEIYLLISADSGYVAAAYTKREDALRHKRDTALGMYRVESVPLSETYEG